LNIPASYNNLTLLLGLTPAIEGATAPNSVSVIIVGENIISFFSSSFVYSLSNVNSTSPYTSSVAAK
jgi:hypothetical protein